MSEETTEQLQGVVEHVTFQNEDSGYGVIQLDCNGELITVVGQLAGVVPGEEIHFEGNYTTHPNYGTQFSAIAYTRKMPVTAGAILKYLSSGVIKGIGKATARRIVEAFGSDTFEVFDKTPQKLEEIKGISYQKAMEIGQEYKRIFGIQTVMSFVAELGLDTTVALSLYKFYGELAIEIISDNPYLLCEEMFGVDFEAADQIGERFDFLKSDQKRIVSGVKYVLRHNQLNGHTCIPLTRLIPTVQQFIGIDGDLIERAIYEAVDEGQLFFDTVKEKLSVFLPEMYQAERYISSRLAMSFMSMGPNLNISYEKQISAYEKEMDIAYADHQKEAITLAMNLPVMVLTGGPGTGKTTTVNAMIELLEEQGSEVCLCAPTGRAAQRMTELSGREAKTIHRLLEVDYNDGSGNLRFVKNEKNLLSCDVVIVDEISMVDVNLFASLLKAMKLTAKLIMVGDHNQLPSVGPGNILKDILESGCVPSVKLTQIFRQAAQSQIVTNAHKIVAGEMPDLESKNSDFFFLNEADPEKAVKTISGLYITRLPKAYNFSPYEDIQILSPTRKGQLGTQNLNTVIQGLINPPEMGKAQIVFQGTPFREGDKVMQTRNNYDIVFEKDGQKMTGIYNGDIGTIVKIDRMANEIIIDFEGKVVTYEMEMLLQVELAYAITVHKSQGNEFSAVIIPLMENKSLLYYRNLLYTAVTRAKSLLIIVGRKSSVEAMVSNHKHANRYTGLYDFLKEEIEV